MTAKMKVRRIVKLSDLKPAKHNPANRIAPHNIKKLADSMELVDLLHPITVTEDNTIIDGHRRVAAAKSLKWTEIECNVVNRDPDEVYASVNVTARRLSGNDALGVWLSNPKAVPYKTDLLYRKIEEGVGRPMLSRIYKAGFTSRIYKAAQQVARYCDDDSSEFVCQVIDWFLKNYGVNRRATVLMASGDDPRVLLKAVKNNRPLTMAMQVA